MGRPLSTHPRITKDPRLKDLSRRLGQCARQLRKMSDEAQNEPISVEALEQMSRDIFNCAHSLSRQSSRFLAQRQRAELAPAASEPPDALASPRAGGAPPDSSELETVSRWNHASSSWVPPSPPSDARAVSHPREGFIFANGPFIRDRLRRHRDEAEGERRFMSDIFMRRRFTGTNRFSNPATSASTRRQFVDAVRGHDASLRLATGNARLNSAARRLRSSQDARLAFRRRRMALNVAPPDRTDARVATQSIASRTRNEERSNEVARQESVSPASPFSEAPIVQTPDASIASTP